MDLNEIKFGYIPSPDDNRDYMCKAVLAQDLEIPKSFSWRDKVPFIMNQGVYGTCTSFASAGIKNVHEIVEGNFPADKKGFSPLFLYTLAKQLDGIPNVEGSYPRVLLKVLQDFGTLPESDLPYSLLKDVFKLPTITEEMKQKASNIKIKSYARIGFGDLDTLKKSLLVSPVLAGVLVTDSFVNSKDGFVGVPQGRMLGGHAIYFVGYDDDLVYTYSGKTKVGHFIFANSWGESFGDKGFGYISYEDLVWRTSDTGMTFVNEMWAIVDEILKKSYWKVQVYGFKVRENTYKAVEKLKQQGFDTYVPPVDEDGISRIQIGAYSIRENAEKMKQKLIDAGYKDAFIVYK